MMVALLCAFLFTFAASTALRWLNLRHLSRFGHQVPEPLEGRIDETTLRRTASYTVDRLRVDLLHTGFVTVLVIFFFFGGWLGAYDRWILSITGSFVGGGTVFFLLLFYAAVFVSVPFNLYATFIVEERFGFNKATAAIWFKDFAKSLLVGTVLLLGCATGALALVRQSPRFAWIMVWLFFCVVAVFLIYVSPYVIEPLFLKFEPIRDAELEPEVRRLAERAGFRVDKVMQVDGSRRSRHSNAYFTGIGRVKRIVLFDTLLEQMSPREILAVVAHEVGHWKKRHIPKRLLATAAVSFGCLYLAQRMLAWNGLPALAGLPAASFPAKVAILGLVGATASFFFAPAVAALSRRQERQADRYACELTGDPGALASALAGLAKDNLSNIHPHPAYAWFWYSHPPVARRIRSLGSDAASSGHPAGQSVS